MTLLHFVDILKYDQKIRNFLSMHQAFAQGLGKSVVLYFELFMLWIGSESDVEISSYQSSHRTLHVGNVIEFSCHEKLKLMIIRKHGALDLLLPSCIPF